MGTVSPSGDGGGGFGRGGGFGCAGRGAPAEFGGWLGSKERS